MIQTSDLIRLRSCAARCPRTSVQVIRIATLPHVEQFSRAAQPAEAVAGSSRKPMRSSNCDETPVFHQPSETMAVRRSPDHLVSDSGVDQVCARRTVPTRRREANQKFFCATRSTTKGVLDDLDPQARRYGRARYPLKRGRVRSEHTCADRRFSSLRRTSGRASRRCARATASGGSPIREALDAPGS